MSDELKQIKKIYGEEMMHMCREMFPSILETEGRLLYLLKTNLAPTHSYASDIKEKNLYEEFKNWIYSFIDVENENQIITNKTPFELMDEAGYTLYECKSEENIQSFKKYYANGEVLCTITNGGRLNRCYVFFAVKKNIDEIKRANFLNPKREDEYGTSVISIQFSRGKTNELSIKNRYNHTVNNPDATFSNNLENIIGGLSNSFERFYGLNIKQNTNKRSDFLTDKLAYVKGNDGRYYRYNLEIDGIYYCENNVIISDGNVIMEYANNPERYILMDEYILDLKEKTIELFEDKQRYNSFIESIYNVGKVEKIEVTKKGNNRVITFKYEEQKEVKIEINKNNAIVGYENNYIKEIGNNFLFHNKRLSSISIPQVKTIGNNFLFNNEELSSISLPQVNTIGDDFLYFNELLSSILLPQVNTIGDDFLSNNEELSSISLPQVNTIGDAFLFANKKLTSISIPQVKTIGNYFLPYNNQLTSISLPQVKTIGYYFLFNNKKLTSISIQQVKRIGNNFLYYNSLIDKEKIFQEMEKRNEEINYSRNK